MPQTRRQAQKESASPLRPGLETGSQRRVTRSQSVVAAAAQVGRQAVEKKTAGKKSSSSTKKPSKKAPRQQQQQSPVPGLWDGEVPSDLGSPLGQSTPGDEAFPWRRAEPVARRARPLAPRVIYKEPSIDLIDATFGNVLVADAVPAPPQCGGCQTRLVCPCCDGYVKSTSLTQMEGPGPQKRPFEALEDDHMPAAKRQHVEVAASPAAPAVTPKAQPSGTRRKNNPVVRRAPVRSHFTTATPRPLNGKEMYMMTLGARPEDLAKMDSKAPAGLPSRSDTSQIRENQDSTGGSYPITIGSFPQNASQEASAMSTTNAETNTDTSTEHMQGWFSGFASRAASTVSNALNLMKSPERRIAVPRSRIHPRPAIPPEFRIPSADDSVMYQADDDSVAGPHSHYHKHTSHPHGHTSRSRKRTSYSHEHTSHSQEHTYSQEHTSYSHPHSHHEPVPYKQFMTKDEFEAEIERRVKEKQADTYASTLEGKELEDFLRKDVYRNMRAERRAQEGEHTGQIRVVRSSKNIIPGRTDDGRGFEMNLDRLAFSDDDITDSNEWTEIPSENESSLMWVPQKARRTPSPVEKVKFRGFEVSASEVKDGNWQAPDHSWFTPDGRRFIEDNGRIQSIENPTAQSNQDLDAVLIQHERLVKEAELRAHYEALALAQELQDDSLTPRRNVAQSSALDEGESTDEEDEYGQFISGPLSSPSPLRKTSTPNAELNTKTTTFTSDNQNIQNDQNAQKDQNIQNDQGIHKDQNIQKDHSMQEPTTSDYDVQKSTSSDHNTQNDTPRRQKPPSRPTPGHATLPDPQMRTPIYDSKEQEEKTMATLIAKQLEAANKFKPKKSSGLRQQRTFGGTLDLGTTDVPDAETREEVMRAIMEIPVDQLPDIEFPPDQSYVEAGVMNNECATAMLSDDLSYERVRQREQSMIDFDNEYDAFCQETSVS